MSALPDVRYYCSWNTFTPVILYPVRWLEMEDDYERAKRIWPERYPLAKADWIEAHTLGYRYCAILEADQVVAIAAIYRNAVSSWEAAAVRTRVGAQRRGCGMSVVSFVTQAILQAGKFATCTTGADNIAMQRTAERVGYILD
jgi:hypothetical protein